jgi:hypothetical protein
LSNNISLYKEETTMAPDKPSDREDEYFMKLDAERIAKKRSELDKKREDETKQHRKDTHWMKCPKCGSDLEEVDFKSVMIDKCGECQGIWLDHGELELLVQGQAQMSKSLLKKLFR